MKNKLIFDETFEGEGLYGLSEDIPNAFCNKLNPITRELPKENNIYSGKFRVTIIWEPVEGE